MLPVLPPILPNLAYLFTTGRAYSVAGCNLLFGKLVKIYLTLTVPFYGNVSPIFCLPEVCRFFKNKLWEYLCVFDVSLSEDYILKVHFDVVQKFMAHFFLSLRS